MIKLIQVEIKKLFSKKGIYIIWFLMVSFCFLNNILFKTDYDNDGNYKYLETENLKAEKKKLEKELNSYDKDNKNEVSMYIAIKTKLDIIDIKKKYQQGSWQYNKANDYLYDTIYQVNYYTYLENNEEELKGAVDKYQQLLNNFTKNNYKYFLKKEIKEKTDIKTTFVDEYEKITDKGEKQKLLTELNNINFDLKILKYRLDENIKEDNSYLNQALIDYQEHYKTLGQYQLLETRSYQEERTYQETMEGVKVNKYILDNKKNINKQNNLSYQLRTIIDDYEILFCILILMIASSIVCDEFKDGTIKLLLIKPYSRSKILLSKYLTTILVIILTIVLLITAQLIIGGLTFSFDSLKMPVVVYNFNKGVLMEYHVFKYMLIRIGAKMPFILILTSLTIFIAVLTCNNIISVTIPLLLYMFNSSLIYLTLKHKLTFMKYAVNLNWNIENYLFGKLPELSFLNLRFSLIILSSYLTIIVILTFIIFKLKNIKNI